MKILVVCDALYTGGADGFALRLAKALSKSHEVNLYCIFHHLHDPSFVKAHAPGLTVHTFRPKSSLHNFFLNRIDGLSKRLGIDFSLRHKFIVKHLRSTAQKLGIEVVNNHLFHSDYLGAQAFSDMPLLMIATMHGAHDGFLSNYLEDPQKAIIKNYKAKLEIALRRLDAVVYNTERNLLIKNPGIVSPEAFSKVIFRKIYYGFEGSFGFRKKERTTLGIGTDELVFGMVARDEPSKGWMPVIKAFLQVQSTGSHLILVGRGPYLDQLKQQYGEHRQIHFVGYSENVLEWIDLFDIGLLPTIYNESLPNTIIEYLFCGKPVITTNIAECAEMIKVENQYAGFVLEVTKDEFGFSVEKDVEKAINMERLATFMETYNSDKDVVAKHAQLAKRAFEKFRMDNCVVAYEQLILDCKQARSGNVQLSHS